jgi:hypothetical protein
MKTIRTVTTIFVAVLLLSVNAYSQNTSVKTLLDKPETRTEVFNTILGDHQLMMEFMTAMKGNEHAMMMMQNSDSQMKGMKENGSMESSSTNHKMHQGEMMGMMKDNPEMMMNMMGNMMDMCEQDSTMSTKMANMMTDHPEMMEMCMKKMNEKGVMGSDGKMKMMKTATPEVKKHHEHK